MSVWSRFVVRHRWWVVLAWLALTAAGGWAAPRATAALTYEFGLPGQPGTRRTR
jgi:RND superfamily putative drug exporter